MFTRTKLPPHVPKTQEDIYNDALQAWIFRLYIIGATLFIIGMYVLKAHALAGVSYGDYLVETTQKHTKPAVKPLMKAKTVHVEDTNVPKTKFDLDKLAHAVAFAESTSCKNAWHNNCHGVKSGYTYPCKEKKGTMCSFKTQAESFKAFKTIWGKWYKTFPTEKQAQIWTGGDSTSTWLAHVKSYYSKH